ncbi:unnamed protein product [Albugo candida]|uniref:Uncharacterized protein n=1 Tax=Albugo candida TaxID=65357 RepID=A0A024FX38_9STRA|nr:unnamed protein product [Albugo candida]|eukprot:CCI11748.1 unnamed protein product [Albugo candida]
MIRVFDLSRPSRDFESRPLAKTKKAKQGQRGLISSIHFNPDHSKMYAAGSFHGTTGLYAEDSGEELMTLCTHEGRGITQVRFSYDGNLLFTAARRDGRIHCWDIRQTNDILTTFHRKADTNQRIAFDLHCGGRYLISGSQDGRALLFDIQKGVQVSEKMRLSDAINGVSFFQDNCPLRIALCSGQRHYTVAPDMEEEEPMENDHQSTSQNVVQVYKYELEFSTLFSKKNDCGKCFLTYTIDSTERSPTPTLSFVAHIFLSSPLRSIMLPIARVSVCLLDRSEALLPSFVPFAFSLPVQTI